MRRLVICCDGTWNVPAHNTNVRKLFASVARSEEQPEPYYDPGVDGLLGGLFGEGISANIRDAYRWLCQNYQPDDQLYLFGFSRGAFTVRSLVGFIRVAGLLAPDRLEATDQGYEVYRSANGADALVAQRFREAHGTRHIEDVRIACLGVWDTVGALGVPVTSLRSLLARRWKFHDCVLSSYVDRAYQALAIDEHRTPFLAAPWVIPLEADPDRQARRAEQIVEQAWFAGAHSDIGGAAGSLAFGWMVDRAREAGLEFNEASLAQWLPAPDLVPTIDDSIPAHFQVAGRVDRPVLDPRFARQALHASIDRRGEYAPDNLRLAREGTPLTRPRATRLRLTIPKLQDYYIESYETEFPPLT
ncbi:MAG: DUF2235 domain-containing protein [Dehalococcoidia bacterium]|nr:DUF2235 domain-containing protein [Dehalococcoidia bacterium]